MTTTLEDLQSLEQGLALLVPTVIVGLTPETPIRAIAPAGLGRAAVFHALLRFGGGQPPELISSIDTVGEAIDWLRVHWRGALPEDLVSATTALQLPSRVKLRAVVPSDYDAIYLASVDPARGFRWRFKGETPSPEDVIGSMWRGIQAQFIVTAVDAEVPIGLVVCYQASLANGTAYIGFQRLLWDRGASGETFEGMLHFVEFLFRTWPLRKLYAEVPGYNMDGVWGGKPTIFTEEGRLHDNEFHSNKLWDLSILTLDRDSWSRWVGPWRNWFGLEQATPPGASQPR